MHRSLIQKIWLWTQIGQPLHGTMMRLLDMTQATLRMMEKVSMGSASNLLLQRHVLGPNGEGNRWQNIRAER